MSPGPEEKKVTLGEMLATMNRAGRRDFLKRMEKNLREGICRAPGCMNKKEVGRLCKLCSEKRRNGII